MSLQVILIPAFKSSTEASEHIGAEKVISALSCLNSRNAQSVSIRNGYCMATNFGGNLLCRHNNWKRFWYIKVPQGLLLQNLKVWQQFWDQAETQSWEGLGEFVLSSYSQPILITKNSQVCGFDYVLKYFLI